MAVLRTKNNTLSQVQEINLATTQTEKGRLRTKYGVSEEENPFLDLQLDLHRYVTVQ